MGDLASSLTPMTNLTKGSAGPATSTNQPLPAKVVYCLYARKSTEPSAEPEVFDAKGHAIYVLTEGTATEKRDLLSNLKSRLVLKNRVFSLMAQETA